MEPRDFRPAVPLANLKPYPGNPRRGDLAAIKDSLERNGQYRPIVVNSRTNEVLAGNHTLAAAKVLGWKRISLDAHERELLERVRASELDELVNADWGPLSPTTRADLRDYLGSIRGVLPSALDDAFAQCSNPAVSDYGARYLSSNRRSLSPLFELIDGSQVLERTRTYGLRQRVRNLYWQRFLVAQRLGVSQSGRQR